MILHELKKFLQEHLSDGLVIIIGSGLSCAEGLPSMTSLAKHLCNSIDEDKFASPDDKRNWLEIKDRLTTDGLEAVLLKTTPNKNVENRIIATIADLIINKEHIVMNEVFDNRRTLKFTRLLKHIIAPNSGIPVITTNYDRLIEVAAEEAGFGVDTMFIGRFAGKLSKKESNRSFCLGSNNKKCSNRYYRKRIVLYKPHGSLDWFFRNNTPVQHFMDVPGATRLIITPGINKFRSGYNIPFDIHRNGANDAINKALRLLIIGYGFNDDHLETYLRPKIEKGTPTVLMTHTLSDNAKKLTNQKDFVAIECCDRGTKVFKADKEFSYTDVSLWDVQNFVEEVLES